MRMIVSPLISNVHFGPDLVGYLRLAFGNIHEEAIPEAAKLICIPPERSFKIAFHHKTVYGFKFRQCAESNKVTCTVKSCAREGNRNGSKKETLNNQFARLD